MTLNLHCFDLTLLLHHFRSVIGFSLTVTTKHDDHHHDMTTVDIVTIVCVSVGLIAIGPIAVVCAMRRRKRHARNGRPLIYNEREDDDVMLY